MKHERTDWIEQILYNCGFLGTMCAETLRYYVYCYTAIARSEGRYGFNMGTGR